ncbi:hypothetical protein QBC46DRAFT_360797 [Diplogelasinospora grovesii]|uniref:CAS1 protein n=1 Tax=Diplogelasinospora grovesii TaxID=303347 RepID=A0AAN6NFI0_9PEZI|nr:hypothetical protein QBC46DRAFT_360797 [Diplogelasinospora grovesii]
MSFKTVLSLSLLACAANLVSAHGAIVAATGDAGGTGMALGIDTTTPRGTRRDPLQQDSTHTFGETVGAGANELEAGTKAIMAETGDQLPQALTRCMINADGTGQDWADIQVTQNAPGRNSNNRQGAATDFPLNAAIPADQTCTGTVAGQDNVCLVRCQNAARAGPFGGVVPVQMANNNTTTTTRFQKRKGQQHLRRPFLFATGTSTAITQPKFHEKTRREGGMARLNL